MGVKVKQTNNNEVKGLHDFLFHLILLEIVFSVLIAHVKCITLAPIYPLIPFPGHYIFVFENEAVSISGAKIKMQKNWLKLAAYEIIVL